jgi:TetR/AcrR family transcriptional regulator, transcriptional repressor of aconitase
VPKVSQEHLDARRRQILDGARAAFAKHGYDGATVAKLEAEIGLSRGAIFNYFQDKLDIFHALANEDSQRWLTNFEEEGIDGLFRRIAAEDGGWIGVYIEVIRRATTDPELRARIEQDEPAPQQRTAGQTIGALQQSGVLRDDVERKAIVAFVNTIALGLLLGKVQEQEVDIDQLLKLVHEGIDAR